MLDANICRILIPLPTAVSAWQSECRFAEAVEQRTLLITHAVARVGSARAGDHEDAENTKTHKENRS